MQNWDCPKCGKTIGGQQHKAAAGQTKLDQTQVQNTINNSDKTGYIMEAGSLEQYKSVREMTSPYEFHSRNNFRLRVFTDIP